MIKINLELPDFDKELSISVTLRKDGEVVKASSSPGVVAEVLGTPKIPETPPTPIPTVKKGGSNLMDVSF